MSNDFDVRFLVADPELGVRSLCRNIGESLGFVCFEAESSEAALNLLEAEVLDVVLADVQLLETSGVGLLEWVKSSHPQTEVAIMAGPESVGRAVAAMKLGAYSYISKPFAPEEMKLLLERMAAKVELMADRDRLRDRVRELEKCIAGFGVRGIGERVDAASLAAIVRPQSAAASEVLSSLPPTDLEHLERVTIARVFEQVHGDKILAGKMLGISRATLYRKLKRYNIGAGGTGATVGGHS